jgi:hypothetical protein
MPLFTVDDIQAGFEETIPVEREEYVETKIAEAETRLRRRLGDLQAWIDAGDTAAARADRLDSLRIVVRNAVTRVLRNPKGFRSESEGNYNYQVDARTQSGTIWISEDDWALLGLGKRRVGSHRLGLPSWSPRNAGLPDVP